MDSLTHGILGAILGERRGATMSDIQREVADRIETLRKQGLIRYDDEADDYHVTIAGRQAWTAQREGK